MRQKHHQITFAIGFLPIALMALATPWGARSMEPTLVQYAELAQSAHKELQILDRDVREMHRTHTLVTLGEDKIEESSIAQEILSTQFNSDYEKYEETVKHIDTLQNRYIALKGLTNPLGNKLLYIDLSEQRANVIENGKIARQYPVSSGAYETPTPQGKFQIHRKQELRVSSQDTPYRMPYYMAFKQSGSHGLHALPYLGDEKTNSDFWHEARSHIGIPVSHGCVRFLPEDAEALYGWIEVGTPVYIDT